MLTTSSSLEQRIVGGLFGTGAGTEGGDGGNNDSSGGGGGGSPPPPPGDNAGGSNDGDGGGSPPPPPPPPAAANSEPPAPDPDAWRAALAGDDPARLEALKAYAKPEDLFNRLNVDWRKQMAGDDPEALKFLEKYNDPSAAYKAWRSAVAKISEGGKIKMLGENATDEERAEWNKAMGVAEDPSKYEIKAELSDKAKELGVQIDEADKEILGEITGKVHEAFKSGAITAPQIVNMAHQLYYDLTAQVAEKALARGLELSQQAEIENRKIWGDENYAKMIEYAIEGAKQFFPGEGPEGEKAFYEFMGTRLETGHALFDHPIMQRMFAQVGLKTIEDPLFLQLGDGKSTFDVEKRIDEIQKLRHGSSAQRAEYARLSVPGGELARLIEAREKRRGQAA
jgi:ribosomal protein L32E